VRRFVAVGLSRRLLKKILLNDDQTIAGLLLKGDEVVSADAYDNTMCRGRSKAGTHGMARHGILFEIEKLRGVPS
jgi:hypothetical protein